MIMSITSCCRLATLLAAAWAITAAEEQSVRLVPQVAYGTAGLEPGLAGEWRHANLPGLIVRPELLLSEDAKLGGGAAVLYDLTGHMELPARQSLAVGPRIVFHHADDTGWEASGLATWSYELPETSGGWQHAVGVLGALGISQDREHDDHDLAATAGVFYAIRLSGRPLFSDR